jgi:hypothetical protein
VDSRRSLPPEEAYRSSPWYVCMVCTGPTLLFNYKSYAAFNEIIMKNDQKIVTAYFKVLSWNSPGQLKKVMKGLRIGTNMATI